MSETVSQQSNQNGWDSLLQNEAYWTFDDLPIGAKYVGFPFFRLGGCGDGF